MGLSNHDKYINMLIESAAEFKQSLPPDARLLGLDVGETTIGLALSDSRRSIATPRPETRGSGSGDAITTRTTPARINASAQGGVWP